MASALRWAFLALALLSALLHGRPASALEEEGAFVIDSSKSEEALQDRPPGAAAAVPLNKWTFAGNVLQDASGSVEHWMVFFCVNWWQGCQVVHGDFNTLGYQWEQRLNTDLASMKVRFAQVDCATEKPLCNEQEVQRYPHVAHYHRHRRVAVWTGGVSAAKDKAGLQAFTEAQLLPLAQSNSTATAPVAPARGAWTTAEMTNGAAALAFAISVLGLQYVIVQGANPQQPAAAEKGHHGQPPEPAAAAGPGSHEGREQAPTSAAARSVPEEWARQRRSIEL